MQDDLVWTPVTFENCHGVPGPFYHGREGSPTTEHDPEKIRGMLERLAARREQGADLIED